MVTYDYKDLDRYDQSVAGDEIWRRYADLRGKCPVGYSEKHGGYFLVTGDAEVKEAASKAAIFSSGDGVLFPPEPHMKFAPIEFDRPEHGWWRGAASAAWKARRRA